MSTELAARSPTDLGIEPHRHARLAGDLPRDPKDPVDTERARRSRADPGGTGDPGGAADLGGGSEVDGSVRTEGSVSVGGRKVIGALSAVEGVGRERVADDEPHRSYRRRSETRPAPPVRCIGRRRSPRRAGRGGPSHRRTRSRCLPWGHRRHPRRRNPVRYRSRARRSGSSHSSRRSCNRCRPRRRRDPRRGHTPGGYRARARQRPQARRGKEGVSRGRSKVIKGREAASHENGSFVSAFFHEG